MLEKIFLELLGYQERMYSKSKESFRDYLFTKAYNLGLSAKIIPESKLAKNVVVGDLDKASIIIGAHYDTPPLMFSWVASHQILFNVLLLVLLWGLIPPIIIFLPFEIGFIVYLTFISFVILYLLGFLSIANKNNYNDNTSGVLAVLNLMHEVKSEKIAYVFFDNEEKGLIGSLILAKYLKNKRKKVIILDCIGVGNTFTFYNSDTNEFSQNIISSFINLDHLHYNHELKKNSLTAASDHLSFRYHEHVGIMAMSRKRGKLVLSDIHSPKDTYIEMENIDHVCQGIKKCLGDYYGIK